MGFINFFYNKHKLISVLAMVGLNSWLMVDALPKSPGIVNHENGKISNAVESTAGKFQSAIGSFLPVMEQMKPTGTLISKLEKGALIKMWEEAIKEELKNLILDDIKEEVKDEILEKSNIDDFKLLKEQEKLLLLEKKLLELRKKQIYEELKLQQGGEDDTSEDSSNDQTDDGSRRLNEMKEINNKRKLFTPGDNINNDIEDIVSIIKTLSTMANVANDSQKDVIKSLVDLNSLFAQEEAKRKNDEYKRSIQHLTNKAKTVADDLDAFVNSNPIYNWSLPNTLNSNENANNLINFINNDEENSFSENVHKRISDVNNISFAIGDKVENATNELTVKSADLQKRFINQKHDVYSSLIDLVQDGAIAAEKPAELATSFLNTSKLSGELPTLQSSLPSLPKLPGDGSSQSMNDILPILSDVPSSLAKLNDLPTSIATLANLSSITHPALPKLLNLSDNRKPVLPDFSSSPLTSLPDLSEISPSIKNLPDITLSDEINHISSHPIVSKEIPDLTELAALANLTDLSNLIKLSDLFSSSKFDSILGNLSETDVKSLNNLVKAHLPNSGNVQNILYNNVVFDPIKNITTILPAAKKLNADNGSDNNVLDDFLSVIPQNGGLDPFAIKNTFLSSINGDIAGLVEQIQNNVNVDSFMHGTRRLSTQDNDAKDEANLKSEEQENSTDNNDSLTNTDESQEENTDIETTEEVSIDHSSISHDTQESFSSVSADNNGDNAAEDISVVSVSEDNKRLRGRKLKEEEKPKLLQKIFGKKSDETNEKKERKRVVKEEFKNIKYLEKMQQKYNKKILKNDIQNQHDADYIDNENLDDQLVYVPHVDAHSSKQKNVFDQDENFVQHKLTPKETPIAHEHIKQYNSKYSFHNEEPVVNDWDIQQNIEENHKWNKY